MVELEIGWYVTNGPSPSSFILCLHKFIKKQIQKKITVKVGDLFFTLSESGSGNNQCGQETKKHLCCSIQRLVFTACSSLVISGG